MAALGVGAAAGGGSTTSRLPEYIPMAHVKRTVPASRAGSGTVFSPSARLTATPRSGTRRAALQLNFEVPSISHVVGIPE